MDPVARELLDFWFGGWTEDEPLPEDSPHMKLWWRGDPATDQEIRDRFADAAAAARDGQYDAWQEDPEEVVALVLLLDQVPRNIFRGTPEAFATDAKAREVVKGALASGLDRAMPLVHRYFLYMPLMHSEDPADHDLAVRRFESLILAADDAGSKRTGVYESALDYEHRHKAIIDRFGRYPHRNKVLGRRSTPEEEAFLLQPGSSF